MRPLAVALLDPATPMPCNALTCFAFAMRIVVLASGALDAINSACKSGLALAVPSSSSVNVSLTFNVFFIVFSSLKIVVQNLV